MRTRNTQRLECERQVSRICPAILRRVQARRRAACVPRIERDEVIFACQAGVLELRREPSRVKEHGVQQHDGRLGWVEAADSARGGVGGVP